MKKKICVSVSAVAALAVLALAAQKSGILHPELKVEQGSYDKPLAQLGTKPSAPWTQTTIDAGVDKKPLTGKIATVVGEVLDLSCYMQLGKRGEKHRSCGQKCVQNGQPIGLLAKDGTVYMLMPEEHDPRRDGGADARPSASEYMGRIVSVTGTETMVNGYRSLYVQGLTR